MKVTLEVCVDTADGLAAALAGGADRIELCASLELGGLTPSPGLIEIATQSPIPVYVMIRPRGGDFQFTTADEAVMLADIAMVRRAGLAGVVLGAAGPDQTLDIPMLSRLVTAASGLGLTVHRVFDAVPDRSHALEQAISLGFERILTSGGAATAPAGADELARLMTKARDRIIIMPGAGVTAKTVAPLLNLPLSDIHGSCSSLANGRRQTSASEVQALKAALAKRE